MTKEEEKKVLTEMNAAFDDSRSRKGGKLTVPEPLFTRYVELLNEAEKRNGSGKRFSTNGRVIFKGLDVVSEPL